jgi:hypothetical protein
MANEEWKTGSPAFADSDVTPFEKWVLFSVHPETLKIIWDCNSNIQSHLSFQTTAQFIAKKHQLTSANCRRQTCLPFSLT